MRRVRHIAKVLLFSTGLFLIISKAEADLDIVNEIRNSQAPNHSVAIFVIPGTNSTERLALMSSGMKSKLADFVLPKAVSAAWRLLATTTIAWKHDSTGVAISFSDKTMSYIFACVVTTDKQFKWIDLGVVEGPNLGVLGRPRSDFVRIEHTPTRWTDAADGTPRMVWVRSRFWDRTGQRYTVEQEFSITPTGEIGWK
jgi:hypothetical protein